MIEPDEWIRQDRVWKQGVNVNWSENVSFSYTVDNRQFSSYQADIEVSVWHSQQKVLDLISQPITIATFDKEQVEWVIDNTELLPSDIPPEQGYEYTVIIKKEKIERKIIVYINQRTYPSEYPAKPGRFRPDSL